MTFEKLVAQMITMIVTKRNILKFSASFYDPLGWIVPVVIRACVIFQSICSMKVQWDDPRSDDGVISEWRKFVAAVEVVKEVKINRYVFASLPGKITSVKLYGFSDASNKVYAAVCYVKASNKHGSIVRVITSKEKVAPLKIKSIPRLELLGCLLLS